MQNVSEDTDDMYDDLIKKYGKVVYKSNDQKSPVAEVDDDAESLSCKPNSQLIKRIVQYFQWSPDIL